MAFIDEIKERAKADKKTIVLPESMDKRTFEAAEKILKEGIANLIIIKINIHFTLLSTFRSNQNHPIGSTSTINGSRTSILQNLN